MTVELVRARESISSAALSVFLAGPTPAPRSAVASWRPEAMALISELWPRNAPTLTVLDPESRGGIPAQHYEDQVDWETSARAFASQILFWIPRDVVSLPGFTTNVEFGLDAATGKVVLGCPPDCPNPERNRYLIYVAKRSAIPVCETLRQTVTTAVGRLRAELRITPVV